MPCYEPDYDRIEKAEREANYQHMTRLLCAICTSVEANNTTGVGGLEVGLLRAGYKDAQGLSHWWTEHKHKDKQRIKSEAAEQLKAKRRQAVIDSLTLEQRKDLGL